MVLENNLVLLNNINLDDYYSSSIFYGFFYLNDDFSVNRVAGLIQDSLRYFSLEEREGFELYSNLVVDENMGTLAKDYGLSNQQVDEYFKPLINLNIIYPVGLDSKFDRHFHYISKDVDMSVLEKIFYVVMIFGGASGNIFLLNEAKGVAIYPHDDRGFGIFALNDITSKNYAEAFLNFFIDQNITITKKGGVH